MRSTRKQPFCWQEKKVLRLLRKEHKKTELVKLRCLYGTITEMDSDFNSKDIKYYTKTIHTYSGLSKDWIPTGLKVFENLGIIKIIEQRECGKFKGKLLIFTPENIKEMPRKTITGESANGESVNGKNDTSEDSILLEDSTSNEDSIDQSIINIAIQKYIPLAKLLYSEHLKLDPLYLKKKDKDKIFYSWADDIRKLIEIDGRSYSEVEQVIRWCKNDDFWKCNIMSGKKLRLQYPKLIIQSKRKTKQENDETDYLDRKSKKIFEKIVMPEVI